MPSHDDIKDWDAIASAYSGEIEARGDRCYPEVRDRFWQLLGDIKGQTILDLGCGQGWLSAELAKRGATATGIDGSAELIARARTLFPGQTFHVANLAEGIPDVGGAFDAVISHMVVMDIPTIETLFRSIGSVLKTGGLFVFTLPHPCFFMQKSHQDDNGQWYKKLTGYLKPETRRIDSFGGHNHYHRPLSAYMNALAASGMLVCEFYEPPHIPRSDRVDPEFLRNFPVFLMIAARKAAPGELR